MSTLDPLALARDPAGLLPDRADRLAYMFGRGFMLAYTPRCEIRTVADARAFVLPNGVLPFAEITEPTDAMRHAFWMTLAGQAGVWRAAS